MYIASRMSNQHKPLTVRIKMFKKTTKTNNTLINEFQKTLKPRVVRSPIKSILYIRHDSYVVVVGESFLFSLFYIYK